ncbi:hypothetical protein D1B31_13915 [Neobacillus notoginsengisoli]|uniref:DUF2273 domain-containing protein n=1 Tax=Neobacillus notoginsengisoli TaxID=1578198 RepID=A0A417YSU8_9BACI|nr:hypothetical protein [Neobacillus notoginsengisoli]RHW39053.1 hypothetical protein D1B31_13915 [Neobacillus notoginsengisoli]
MRTFALILGMVIVGFGLFALDIFGFAVGFGILGGLMIEILIRLNDNDKRLRKSNPGPRHTKSERRSWVERIEE